MNAADLQSVIADINRKPITEDAIVAVGPLVRQPSTSPYRVVLHVSGDQFVVHDEVWDDVPAGTLDLSKQNGYYIRGDYYDLDQLDKALQRFAERCNRDVAYMKSIYRSVA